MDSYTGNWKNIKQITLYFVDEGPGPDPEDIKKKILRQLF